MAYFANGTDGAKFYDECNSCQFNNKNCPIQEVQDIYNYEAARNITARNILNSLVKDNGECTMLRRFPEIKSYKAE